MTPTPPACHSSVGWVPSSSRVGRCDLSDDLLTVVKIVHLPDILPSIAHIRHWSPCILRYRLLILAHLPFPTLMTKSGHQAARKLSYSALKLPKERAVSKSDMALLHIIRYFS